MDDLRLYGCYGNETHSLFQTANVVSEDIGMIFWIEKCAALAVKKKKEVACNGINWNKLIAI